MQRRTKASLTALLLGLAAAPIVASDAKAGWPPPPTATAKDMADPANWPNDPGYGFDKNNDGQWNLYSFMPSVVTSPRPSETASGMSVDLAWRLTTGDDSVHLAITDSGIKWDEPDLIEKVALNLGELASHKPTHADGSACMGSGSAPDFDCNGDGVVSISDWAETPTLKPVATMGHPLGDANQNGYLDPGDLILNFSDGVDDDANGYVDDIAGWDFMKDDNDPYDDTRYGHGTGEARDSSAQTNNMIGDAGVCPKCRFVPTRVGDSFIADVNAFGKAIIYATDNHVSIIQCALGTINNDTFSQAAIDYAYSKGVLPVVSMADENSRHHNMPAVSNHTMPVHAIEYDGAGIADSTSFLVYHPCSNFGGHNFLSASGTSCSSEATGKMAGMAGLLYSASIKYGLNPPLSPAEAMSVFFTTTDDINIPESRMPDADIKWSQEGFDQRFGYGRVNANRAIEAIRDKKIPPAVDITSPTWYTVLYKDQAQGPIDIVGTVSAKRANSFDYVVEWGPGVQPLDGEFKVIKKVDNVPPAMVIGQDGPLASLDIRTIDPAHTRDSDSGYGENDHTITVRVRSTAHYGDPVGDVKGELRRTYYVHSDPDLVKGFPIYLGSSGESSPKMEDLDGDGVRELIVPTSGGEIHVYKLTSGMPVELAGFPFLANPEDGLMDPPPTPKTPVYIKDAAGYKPKGGPVDPNLGREPFGIAPAIGDIDGDGKPEIIASSFTGTIYCIKNNGSVCAGFPIRLPDVPSCPTDPTQPKPKACMDERTRITRGAFAAPVLADMNMDGKLDIIQAAFDGKIYVFDGSGKAVDGWPAAIHYTGKLAMEPDTNRIMTTPAIYDFTGDGIPDLLVGSNERLGNGGQSGAIYLVDGRGTKAGKDMILPNWPVTMTSLELFPLVAEGVPNSGVIGTFGDKPFLVMHGNASVPLILPKDPGTQDALGGIPTGSQPVVPDPDHPDKMRAGIAPASSFGSLSMATQPNTMLPLFAQPSLGDIDQDGVTDVVASGGSLNLAINLQGKSGNLKGDHLLAMWSGKTGEMMPASPMILEDFTFFNSQAIADLNGDGYPEVITGSGGYFLHAYDGCGREPKGWPKFTGQWIIPTAVVGDVDGDHKLEVAVNSRSGWLYLWHTEANADEATIEWESFHHDARNTGFLGTPLTQGGKKKAAKPLTADSCMAVDMPMPMPTPQGLVPSGGGCGCNLAGDEKSGAYALALLGLGLVVRRRRNHAKR